MSRGEAIDVNAAYRATADALRHLREALANVHSRIACAAEVSGPPLETRLAPDTWSAAELVEHTWAIQSVGPLAQQHCRSKRQDPGSEIMTVNCPAPCLIAV